MKSKTKPSKAARYVLLVELWDLWSKGPAALHLEINKDETPSDFLNFVEAVSRNLPDEIQLGKRRAMQKPICKLRKDGLLI